MCLFSFFLTVSRSFLVNFMLVSLMLQGVFLFVTFSYLFCYLNFFFFSLPEQLPFSFFTSPSNQAGQLWLGILKQRMKKEPAPSLITPKFESLLEHQFFFAVNKCFVRKTHRKVIAPKALCWMHSEVVFTVREEKLFTGICRSLWSLLWLREISTSLLCSGKSFTKSYR